MNFTYISVKVEPSVPKLIEMLFLNKAIGLFAGLFETF